MADTNNKVPDSVIKAGVDAYINKHCLDEDGLPDPEKVAKIDLEDEATLEKVVAEGNESMALAGLTPEHDYLDARERYVSALAQTKKRADEYNSDRAKAEFEDKMTGGNSADNVVFRPQNVDYQDKSHSPNYTGPDDGSGENPPSGNPGEEGDDDATDDGKDEDGDIFDDVTPGEDEEYRPANTVPGQSPQSSGVAGSDTQGGDPGDLDNSKAFASVKDTSNNWSRMAYGIMVGHDYHDYREALKHHLSILIKENGGGADAESLLKQAENDPNVQNVNGAALHDKHIFRTMSVSDASVGGNDAINPYSAFNVDDDIIHDVSIVGNNEYGMGRCYAEMYESKQQILYLTMGIPKYRNLRTWLQNAVNKEMSELNDVGEPTGSLIGKLGKLITGGIKLAIELPWLPFIWTANIINSIKDYKITEYFYFRDNMPLYLRYVNSILSEIAVGMGIYGTHDDDGGPPSADGANMSSTDQAKLESNLPAIMKEGPDIFKILSRRALRMKSGVRRVATDDMLIGGEKPQGSFDRLNSQPTGDKGETGWKDSIATGLKNFWTGIQIGALEGMNFIGFRIEKNDSANESFSNQTQESPLLATLNQEVAKKREINLGAATSGTDSVSKLNRLVKSASNFTSNVTSIFSGKKGFEGTIAYMASGNGYFDLPKQWSGSAGMSRSLSFNMKLRAKTGGDNVSIFQSIMIPLSCLMAAALPRAVGDTAYTSPFLVRAFCKGMFAVPAGIISSLAINRGASEFGWSLSKLPTVVDVTFTIEDLSPMLFLSIAGGKGMLDAIGQAFTNNTKMHEYINTLVGIGAKERYYRLGQLKRRLKTALLIGKNTTFSATYRGYVMGDSSIVRSVMALTPYTWVKNN